jgi:hypothetical protein
VKQKIIDVIDGLLENCGLQRINATSSEEVMVLSRSVQVGTTFYSVRHDQNLEVRHIGYNDRGKAVMLMRFREDHYPARWLEYTPSKLRNHLNEDLLVAEAERIKHLSQTGSPQ